MSSVVLCRKFPVEILVSFCYFSYPSSRIDDSSQILNLEQCTLGVVGLRSKRRVLSADSSMRRVSLLLAVRKSCIDC